MDTKPKLSTRKPVEKITETDLSTYPIWEYATNEEDIPGQDETWIRPTRDNKVPSKTYSRIVAADFVTSKSVRLPGFVIVTTATKQLEVTPGAVLISGKYLTVDALPERSRWQYGIILKERERLCASLKAHPRDVFPLQYTVRVPISGLKGVCIGSVK